MRAYAFDALVNSETGIERVIATPAGRSAFTHRFDAVRIVEGDKPTIAISGRTSAGEFRTRRRRSRPGVLPRHRLCAGQDAVLARTGLKSSGR